MRVGLTGVMRGNVTVTVYRLGIDGAILCHFKSGREDHREFPREEVDI